MRETWIRIVIYRGALHGSATQMESLRYTAQSVIRVLTESPGYLNGYWADDPETGRMAAITFWDSRHAIEAADLVLQRVHRDREELGVLVETISNFRLLAVKCDVEAWIEDAHAVGSLLRQDR